MWELKEPKPVKLIIGILASEERALAGAREAVDKEIGKIDLASEVWPFTQTDYYKDELGSKALRQFVTIENLIDPGRLAQIKHDTNSLEQRLADSLKLSLPRPVNLDPGFIEPSKLILASTKNFSHRIYIGNKMYAEVTLMYEKGGWRHFEFTFPDYRQANYQEFFTKVRKQVNGTIENIISPRRPQRTQRRMRIKNYKSKKINYKQKINYKNIKTKK